MAILQRLSKRVGTSACTVICFLAGLKPALKELELVAAASGPQSVSLSKPTVTYGSGNWLPNLGSNQGSIRGYRLTAGRITTLPSGNEFSTFA